MGIQLNTTSGGSVTLEPEDTVSNVSITVPADTGAVPVYSGTPSNGDVLVHNGTAWASVPQAYEYTAATGSITANNTILAVTDIPSTVTEVEVLGSSIDSNALVSLYFIQLSNDNGATWTTAGHTYRTMAGSGTNSFSSVQTSTAAGLLIGSNTSVPLYFFGRISKGMDATNTYGQFTYRSSNSGSATYVDTLVTAPISAFNALRIVCNTTASHTVKLRLRYTTI